MNKADLKGYLRAIRIGNGKDPFFMYQEALMSKGMLLGIITEHALEWMSQEIMKDAIQ